MAGAGELPIQETEEKPRQVLAADGIVQVMYRTLEAVEVNTYLHLLIFVVLYTQCCIKLIRKHDDKYSTQRCYHRRVEYLYFW